MRFADIFGKGLVGAITGIDLTDMVKKGGVVGAITGFNPTDGLAGADSWTKAGVLGQLISGDITGAFTNPIYRPGDKPGIIKGPYKPDEDDSGFIQMPYYPEGKKGYGFTHGIMDFENEGYRPKGMNDEDFRDLNDLYPLGNISK